MLLRVLLFPLSVAVLLLVSCGDATVDMVSGVDVDTCLSASQVAARECAVRMVPSGEVVYVNNQEVILYGRKVCVGDKALDFSCVGANNQPIGLSTLAGKIKVLSIYPSLDTRVCSLQTRTFNERLASLPSNVVALSLSVDLPFAMNRYCGMEGIDQSRMYMASDYRWLDFGLKYGMVMDGFRLLTRAVVVIDANDVVRYVEYVKNLSDEPNYEQALECVEVLLSE